MYRSLTQFDPAALIAVFGGTLIALLALWDYVATRRAPWEAAARFAATAAGVLFGELPTEPSSQSTKWVLDLWFIHSYR